MNIKELNQLLKNKSIEEAKKLLPDMTFRVTRLNGNPTLCTRDVRSNRINVELLQGLIVNVTNIG